MRMHFFHLLGIVEFLVHLQGFVYDLNPLLCFRTFRRLLCSLNFLMLCDFLFLLYFGQESPDLFFIRKYSMLICQHCFTFQSDRAFAECMV